MRAKTSRREITPGHNNKWIVWRTLDHLHTGVEWTRKNLKKWGNNRRRVVNLEKFRQWAHLVICNNYTTRCEIVYLKFANN